MKKVDTDYQIFKEQIGKAFRDYRQRAELSLTDIYKYTNISRALVSSFENGRKIPRIETLFKLMKVADMPLWRIFNYGNSSRNVGLTKNYTDSVYQAKVDTVDIINNIEDLSVKELRQKLTNIVELLSFEDRRVR